MLPIVAFDSYVVDETADDFNDNFLIAISQPPTIEEAVRPPSVLGVLVKESCPLEKQCISYVQSRGLQIKGDAKDIRPNSDVPCVGCGILLCDGRWCHLAYIEEVLSDSVYVCEQNWEGCGIVSCRTIALNDPKIIGFVR